MICSTRDADVGLRDSSIPSPAANQVWRASWRHCRSATRDAFCKRSGSEPLLPLQLSKQRLLRAVARRPRHPHRHVGVRTMGLEGGAGELEKADACCQA